jgi:hypothetical protein
VWRRSCDDLSHGSCRSKSCAKPKWLVNRP